MIFALFVHNNTDHKTVELEFWCFAAIFLYFVLIIKDKSKLDFLEVFGHFPKSFTVFIHMRVNTTASGAEAHILGPFLILKY